MSSQGWQSSTRHLIINQKQELQKTGIWKKINECCQSAKVGQIGTRENCCYGEAALSFLTVRL